MHYLKQTDKHKNPLRVPKMLYCETSRFKFNNELRQYILWREDMMDKMTIFLIIIPVSVVLTFGFLVII